MMLPELAIKLQKSIIAQTIPNSRYVTSSNWHNKRLLITGNIWLCIAIFIYSENIGEFAKSRIPTIILSKCSTRHLIRGKDTITLSHDSVLGGTL